MTIRFLLGSFLLITCVSAQADGFLRATQNSGPTAPAVAGGSNRLEVKSAALAAAGIWRSKIFTHTKSRNISPVAQYHLRGTHNNWAEGDLLTPVAGSATNYEACRFFGWPSATLNPSFKVDTNGGWGADVFPAQEYSVAGWTKIIINGSERKIVSVTTKLPDSCSKPIVFTQPGPITLHVGEVFYNYSNIPFLEYSSSNPAVATVVVYNGEVTVVGVGTATISAKEELCDSCYHRTASYVINAVP